MLVKIRKPFGKETMKIHDHLYYLMSDLGYEEDLSAGLCYGIAFMAMQAALLGEKGLNEFNARINRLLEYTPQELVNDIENKKSDQEIIDIRTFFDGVYGYLKFGKLHHLSKNFKGARNQDGMLAQQLVSSIQLGDQGFSEICSFSGVYNEDELGVFFKALKQSVDENQDIKDPISFSFGSHNHQITLSSLLIENEKGVLERKWFLADAGYLDDEEITEENFSSLVQRSFFYEKNIVISTSVFSRTDSLDRVKKVADSLRKNDVLKKLHTPSEEKLSKTDPAGFNFFSAASIRDQVDFLKSIESNISKAEIEISLILAIKNQANKSVEFFLEKFNTDDVNSYDDSGKTPIFHAIEFKNLKAIEMLVKKGAKLNLRDVNEETPFMAAVRTGNIEILEFLVKQAPRLDDQNKHKQTAVGIAIQANKIDSLGFLMEKGRDADYKNSRGESPVFEAIRHNNREALEFLIKQGSNIDWKRKSGETPLVYAVKKGNIEAFDSLMKNKLKNGLSGNSFNEIVSLLERNQKNDWIERINLLKEFIEKNNEVQLLIEQAKLNNSEKTLVVFCQKHLKDYFFKTSQTSSGKKFVLEKSFKFIEFLKKLSSLSYKEKSDQFEISFLKKQAVEKGEKFKEEPFLFSDTSSFDPVYFAVKYKDINALKRLINKKLNLDKENENGETPVFLAVKNNDLDSLGLLIEGGVNLNHKDGDGYAPIFCALEDSCSIEVLKLLIQGKADLKCETLDGCSLLIYAIGYHVQAFNIIEKIKFLIEKGVDLNHAISGGVTAIHMAIQYGQMDCLELLIKQGAKLDVVLDSGENLLEFSKQFDNGSFERITLAQEFFNKTHEIDDLMDKKELMGLDRDVLTKSKEILKSQFFGENVTIEEKTKLNERCDSLIASLTKKKDKNSDLTKKKENLLSEINLAKENSKDPKDIQLLNEAARHVEDAHENVQRDNVSGAHQKLEALNQCKEKLNKTKFASVIESISSFVSAVTDFIGVKSLISKVGLFGSHHQAHQRPVSVVAEAQGPQSRKDMGMIHTMRGRS